VTDGSSRQERIWALFEAALDLPPEERRAFFERHGDDTQVVAEVEGLLAGHERSGGILDQPLAGDTPPAQDDPGLEDRVRAAFERDYGLVRELGRGGMSRVYLAWERKHQRRVVLKVLRPTVAALHGSDRFVREANLIARLSHPNIIPLIDSGVRDDLAYYVMPYIDGITLREEMRASPEGRLPPERALPLLRDVAQALAFAHVAGVVHRDLKPDNVLLAGHHTYLFDFGIARATRPGTHDATLVTREGAFLGTPGYAAPEQVWGGRTVDHRADLWAWGVLAWEVLTGELPPLARPPGDGAAPGPATDLRDRVPEVPRTVAEAVRGCIQPDPADRPEDAAAILEALGEAEPGIRASAASSGRRTSPLHILVPAAGVVLAAWGGWALSQRSADPTSVAPGTLRLPIAVAPFGAETADSATAVFGRFASDWVTQGLQDVDGVQVVPWPATRAAAEEARESDVVRSVADATGAGTVISGSVFELDGRVRFSAEIVDAATGLVVSAPDPVSVPRDSAEEGLGRLVDRLRASVAIGVDPRLAAIPGLARHPPSFEAYRAFDRGVELATVQDYAPAAAAFREAWSRDTTFHQALVFAAVNHVNRNEYAVADSLLDRVEPHLDRLTTAERLRWELARGYVDGDVPRAYRATTRLVELAPGSRAPYNAARLAMGLNRPREARDLLLAADPDRGELRGWAQYWTQLAHAQHMLGDFEAEARAAAEMRRRYPERRIALVLEARARASAGDLGGTQELIEVAQTLDPETYWSAGSAAVVAAEALKAHGHDGWAAMLETARGWLEERLAIEPGYRSHRYWLASVHYDARRWDAAAAGFRDLLDETPGSDTYRGMLAVSLGHTGAVAEAEALLAEGFDFDPGVRSVYRARLAALQGDADTAAGLLGAAFAQGVDGWAWMHASGFDDFAAVADDPRIARLLSPTR
jgi:TolB-like protein/predicted Zn-dependent protease